MNAKPTAVLLSRELFSTLPVWTWDRNGKHSVMHQESLKVHGFIPGFLNSSTINIFGLIILCCEGLSFHCMTFSSISILYSLDSSSITPTTVLIHVLTNQKCLQTFPNAPGAQNCPWLRTIALFKVWTLYVYKYSMNSSFGYKSINIIIYIFYELVTFGK